jgi:enoyl-CoA hydratase/carnithine racemase
MPGGGATQRLTRAVGKFAAMKILLTGEPFSASEAKSLGLISELVNDAEVESRALSLAQHIKTLPPLSVRFIKEAVLESMNTSLDAGLRFERRAFQTLFSTHDKTEGIRARLEKRQPVFKGE